MRSRLVAGAAAAFFLALAALSARASAPFGEAPAARSKRGMVSAATPESVEAGARVLAAGGGAVDAAISAAFVLAVTYPQAGNLAGGGFAVVRTAEGGFFALDFRETAPAGTWRNTFLDAGGASRPQASRYGGLAVATPGTVRGLEALHRRFGRLPWSRLVAPAIALARDGYRVPPGLARELAEEQRPARPVPRSARPRASSIRRESPSRRERFSCNRISRRHSRRSPRGERTDSTAARLPAGSRSSSARPAES